MSNCILMSDVAMSVNEQIVDGRVMQGGRGRGGGGGGCGGGGGPATDNACRCHNA